MREDKEIVESYKVHERLNTVENEVVSVKAKIEGIETGVNRLIVAVDNIALSDKTNWGTLAAWAAIILSCVSALLYHNSLTLSPLEVRHQYQEKYIEQLAQRVERLEDDKGHSPIQ